MSTRVTNNEVNSTVRYLRHLSDIPQLTDEERIRLEAVTDEFAFRVSDYYLNLINWDDPRDALRRLVIPVEEELEARGELDPSREADYTVAPGTQHKYPHTALLLAVETCAAYCRYCFRKRLFMRQNGEVPVDTREGVEYIRRHPEINNVLITGGDPLVLATGRLESILADLDTIDHLRFIRIGSKMLAFNPMRVSRDERLLEVLEHYSRSDRRIYLMAHFTHPREVTPQAVEAIVKLKRAGVEVMNQCPLIRGVNDDPEVLGELYNKLLGAGVSPYYLFQNRPTRGNSPFAVPLVEGYHILQSAFQHTSGLGRRVRYSMSHHTGKIEVVGVDEKHIYLRNHRSPRPEEEGRFRVFHRDDTALWLDDLNEVESLGAPVGEPMRFHG